MIKKIICTTVLVVLIPHLSWSQSIAEKKAHLKGSESDLDVEMDRFLLQINQETQEIQENIHSLYAESMELYGRGAPESEYRQLLVQIKTQKRQLNLLENQWRELAAKSGRTESYGLWHAPDTNLEQLIIDYGSQDYVYLIPPEVGSIKLSIDSNLPIPRASWGEMLDLVLIQNGVGVQTLNPYLRQLYLLKQNHSNLLLITNKRSELEFFPPDARICFVISPEPSEIRRSFAFLEKFINTKSSVLHALGRDILVIGPVGEIQSLLKMYDFISNNRGEKDYRIIPLNKTNSDEMAKVLAAIFDQSSEPVVVETKTGVHFERPAEVNGLKIVVLQNDSQALFVVGTKEEVKKAEDIVRNVESQIGGARDRVVHWYTIKHSDPEELADVLFKVYNLMISTGTSSDSAGQANNVQNQINVVDNPRIPVPLPPPPQQQPPDTLYGEEGFYQEGGFIVNPRPSEPRAFTESQPNQNRDNFIIDPKTGSMVMVVESDALPKLKELIKRLDVPKKMVQIETLLFEKVLTRENSYGLNLLKIGEGIASNSHITGAVFNNLRPHKGHGELNPANAGVFEFFMSRKQTSSGIPAFDLAYKFLLNQEDVQINSCPSILALNQTPATIAINEDISINTGIFEVETAKGVTLKDAYTRAQYGVTISLKPMIHLCCDSDSESEDIDYVTLETDITFDTIHPGSHPSRPNVTRRHITNNVLVPDGQTVVLGNLRSKDSHDRREAVPFIGELPGLGKLFSINAMRDRSTEMFIFITPHIVKDPKEQLECLRQELLCLRPGDIPYFLECVDEAHEYERTKLIEGSMLMLLGRPKPRYYMSSPCADESEYDGK